MTDDVTGIAEDAVARIEGLRSALDAAEGRLGAELLADAGAVLERSRERLRLSAAHTVVTLAGATGSGKSSLFNALTGLELAGVGARRPTTSWATACAWDPLGAADLLDWLGLPARHQVSRLSMLDASPEDTDLRGLVLLDLPDHDSTEVAHHLEVDRLVQYADLLVWVLDPQKYADAALHERYLRPYAGHAEVMLVVLNQVDRLADSERAATLADVRRLLDADGLGDVPLLAVSAKVGHGLPELRALLVQRLRDKQLARERVTADVASTADELSRAAGAALPAGAAPEVAEALRGVLVDECTAASGADGGAADAPGVAAARARVLAGWPLLLPVRRGTLTEPGQITAPGAPDRARLDVAVDAYTDAMADELAAPWARAVRAAAEPGRERLPAALSSLDGRAGGASGAAAALPVAVLQGLLLLTALGGVAWQLVGRPDWLLGLVVAAVALAVGGVLDPIGGALAARWAAGRAEGTALGLREQVAAVADELVVAPVAEELAAYAQWRAGLAAARADAPLAAAD